MEDTDLSILRPASEWHAGCLLIGADMYRRTDLVTYEHAAQRLYKHAYTEKLPVSCLCCGEDKPVAVHLAKRDDVFFVRRNPNSAHEHDALCESSYTAKDLLQQRYGTDAVREAVDGGAVRISLNQPLSESVLSVVRDRGAAPTSATARAPRHAVSQNDLLAYVWEDAGLSAWHGGQALRRTWKEVRETLVLSLQGLRIGALIASYLIYIPAAIAGASAEERERSRLRNERAMNAQYAALARRYSTERQAIMMVLAPVRAYELGKSQPRYLELMHLGAVRLIEGDEPVLRSVARVYGGLLRRVENSEGKSRAIALAAVVCNAQGEFEMRSCAMLEITPQYLSITTRYELHLIDKLVQMGIPFTKPALNTRTDGNPVAVLQTPTRTMEMHIVDGNEDERDAAKAAIDARQEHEPERDYWVWDVTESDTIPPIPAE
jgi:hypothetical protein